MRFEYVGAAGIRILKEYCWRKENGYVQDIKDPELIENLLTYPTGEFIQLDDEDDAAKKKKKSKPAESRKPRKKKTGKKNKKEK